MLIEYNGVSLVLTDLIGYEREGIYSSDGADLLYVKHTINCVCYLAPTGYPQATSINLRNVNLVNNSSLLSTSEDLQGTGGPGNPSVRDLRGRNPPVYDFSDRETNGVQNAGPGVVGLARGDISNSAFITDAELRMRLMQPRKKLKITAWRVAQIAEFAGELAGLTDFEKIVWLESPRPIAAPAPAASAPAPRGPSTLGTGAKDGAGRNLGFSGTAGPPTPPQATESPTFVYPPTDAANGPIPLRVDVVEAAGNGASMTVNFQISTCLVPVDPNSERLVLSHRWQVTHSQDEHHYLTRTITGEIIFNGGLYRQMDKVPSDFLSQLLHPIPLGFKRMVPHVVQSSDGLVIQYTVVDVDTTITFDPGNSGCTNINIVENLQYLQPSVWLGNRF